jgi:hypothetical protein
MRGTVRVSARDITGRLRFLDLANCLYVPSLSHSLFSIPSYLKAHRENTVTFLQDKIVFHLPGHVQIEIPANNFNKVIHAMSADMETTKNLNKNVNKNLFYFKSTTIPSVDPNLDDLNKNLHDLCTIRHKPVALSTHNCMCTPFFAYVRLFPFQSRYHENIVHLLCSISRYTAIISELIAAVS